MVGERPDDREAEAEATVEFVGSENLGMSSVWR